MLSVIIHFISSISYSVLFFSCVYGVTPTAPPAIPSTVSFDSSKHGDGYTFVSGLSPDLSPDPSAPSLLPKRKHTQQSKSFKVFGAHAWQQYLGAEVGADPPLPAHLQSIMEGACPFFAEKRICDTHLLVLIPSTLKGQSLSLNLLGSYYRGKFPRNASGYRTYSPLVKAQYGTQKPITDPYWLLITRDIIPESMNLAYPDQLALLESGEHTHLQPAIYQSMGYVPPLALEVTIAALAHYAHTSHPVRAWCPCLTKKPTREGDYLLPTAYTNCHPDQLIAHPEDLESPIAVGGFSSAGLAVRSQRPVAESCGIMACRHLTSTHETPKAFPRLSAERLRKLCVPEEAFGAAQWEKYFGVKVVDAPPLPDEIEAILDERAPFVLDNANGRQTVRASCMLTLIPREIKLSGDEQVPFTLDQLGQLLLDNNKGYFGAFSGNTNTELGANSHGYGYYSKYLTSANRTAPHPDSSCWVLVSKDVLKHTRSKTFDDQKKEVSKYAPLYGVPRVLEVATSVLGYYAAHDQARLYADSFCTYTRCQDLGKNGSLLVVGGFTAAGRLAVDFRSSHIYVGCSGHVGMSCSRKF